MRIRNIDKYQVYVGKRISDLKILYLFYLKRGKRSVDLMAHVQCKCMKEFDVRFDLILKGATKSCGCRKYKHGKHDCKLYQVWHNMKNRCINPNATHYRRYGGRGIQVCDEWKNDFRKFYDWAISSGWRQGLQIDRINNDGNYCPENCRFVSRTENVRNRDVSENLEYNWRRLHITEWAKIKNMSVQALHNRIYRGWSIKDALEIPVKQSNPPVEVEFRGEVHNCRQWELILNLPRGTIRNRMRLNWPIERIFSVPVRRIER